MSSALLLLSCLLLTLGSEVLCQDCRTPMTASKLRKDIFCGYDRTVRPVKNFDSVIAVEVHTQIKFLLFNEYSDDLYVNSRMIWTWTDEFLTWSPERYSGIKSIPVSSSSIWVPDLILYHNGLEELGREILGSSKCMLESTGKIRCMPSAVFPADCETKTVHWPFMRAHCFWHMSSLTHYKNHVNISLLEGGIDLRQYQPNTEWELLRAEVELKEEVYNTGALPYFEFYVGILRHSAAHEATILTPAIAVCVLTLLVFCLPAASTERMALGCLSLFMHCFYMQHLGFEMPLSKDECPTTLNFFRVSLLITAGSLLQTAFNNWMRTTPRSPPQWLNHPADYMLRAWRLRRQLQRLLPEDGDVGEEATESVEKESSDKQNLAQAEARDVWCLLATIMDIVSFIIAGSTLGILLTSVFNEKYRA